MAENNITTKYRPKKFADILGQVASVQSITASLQSKVIPPAYLFFGTRGCGKTSAARLVALSLNCKQRTGAEPCGGCPDCRDILMDMSDYLQEFDGATSGKVEDVRNLMASVRFLVPDGSYKVIIIDECHMLTKEAWNAALKTIEEPPRNVLFIFCTTELQKVIPAVKSRCVPIQFPGVHDSVISDMLRGVLKAEGVEYDEDSIQLITHNAHGSIRDAQSILEGFIRTGKVSADQVKRLYQTIDPMTILTYFNNVLADNVKQAATMTGGWLRLGAGPELIVSSLLEHLRNMVLDFIVQDETLKTLLKAQRAKIGEVRLVQWIEFFYTQLRFIREFPMEHTLIIDLITIKLIGTMKEPSAKAKKAEAKEDTPLKNNAPAISENNEAVPLDKDKVNQLVDICGGSLDEVHPRFFRVTIKNSKGTVFDVVSDPKYAKNMYYIRQEDMEFVIRGYPNSMESAVKIKL